MKILLIEDDSDFASVLTDDLKREFKDPHVETIESEAEFLDNLSVIASDPPNVIVLDMFLPFSREPLSEPISPSGGHFKGGLRCIEQLQSNEQTRNIPVILHSAGFGVPSELPSNVISVPKSGDLQPLFTAIRSVLFSKRPAKEQRVFIVHGHDEHAKEVVARFIEKLGLQSVVLQERPSGGRAIFEKLETYGSTAFAVILLTPDDVGTDKANVDHLKPRARQNVLLELGYFLGKLGAARVCALVKDTVEIPSDYHGVVYIKLDASGAWRSQLAMEMRSAGLRFNAERLIE